MMKIKELKEKIANLPDNMDVFIGERVTEYSYGLVNSADVRNILFYDMDDSDNEEIQVKENVFVLTEE
ncbi:hypothetical protein [Elizabethkingia miricola]|uniref:hypothetical protein n=1 Tax=Elizabethkingia miricola TaxID=172045 RepID=UPI0011864716|nr:hypothetical protein [Elizabethkingia miricola]